MVLLVRLVATSKKDRHVRKFWTVVVGSTKVANIDAATAEIVLHCWTCGYCPISAALGYIKSYITAI